MLSVSYLEKNVRAFQDTFVLWEVRFITHVAKWLSQQVRTVIFLMKYFSYLGSLGFQKTKQSSISHVLGFSLHPIADGTLGLSIFTSTQTSTRIPKSLSQSWRKTKEKQALSWWFSVGPQETHMKLHRLISVDVKARLNDDLIYSFNSICPSVLSKEKEESKPKLSPNLWSSCFSLPQCLD